MARQKSRASILADIEALRKQLAESEEREERRIGRLANKAGLLDLDLSDEDLTKAFSDLARRFRGTSKSAAPVSPPSSAEAATQAS